VSGSTVFPQIRFTLLPALFASSKKNGGNNDGASTLASELQEALQYGPAYGE